MKTLRAWLTFLGTVVTALTVATADDVLNVSDASALVVAILPAAATLYGVFKVEQAPPPNAAQREEPYRS